MAEQIKKLDDNNSIDQIEISEWIESLDGVVQNHGKVSAKLF